MKWSVFPSEKAAERARRDRFAKSGQAVWLGETIFSLPHFLKTLADPKKPLLSRKLQNHLLIYFLKQMDLKYFSKPAFYPSLAKSFLRAIRKLKRYEISKSQLEKNLQEWGSLKEYDLLKTYELYEAWKEKRQILDPEDLYAISPSGLESISEIHFENFSDFPLSLQTLIDAVKRRHPERIVEQKTIPALSPQSLQGVQLFSLPSPTQETNWFLGQLWKILRQGMPLDRVGIMAAGPSSYFEAIWQHLKQAGLCSGPSPFLNFKERPEGAKILKEAGGLDLHEATLEHWLTALLGKLEEGEGKEFLESHLFAEAFLSLGKWEKKDWLLWLQAILEEKPARPIPQALEGLQWLQGEEGDFPELEYLWVPGFVWGQFPSTESSPFFQDGRDRAQKEWEIISQAFEDPQTLFEKKQRLFLHQLSRARHTWLTYPRLDSQGQDLFCSPWGTDFKKVEDLPTPSLPFFLQDKELAEAALPALSQKLTIEQERLRGNLQTKIYHANLTQDFFPPNPIFSPTQLETFAQCPYKYYAQRILKLPRLKEYSPEVDPEDKGTLFHNCLETLLSQEGLLFAAARDELKKENELYDKLEIIVEKVFKEGRDEYSYAHPELYAKFQALTFSRGKELLKKELEEARELYLPLTPTHFEWTFGADTQDALSLDSYPDKKPIYIRGRIDRIDLDEEKKRFLILDYKTGTVESLKDKLLEGLSLQLPLYILAVRKLLLDKHEPIGGLLISARTGEKKHGMVDKSFNKTHFKLHARSNALLKKEELETMIARTVQQVSEYVLQIRAGNFSPLPKACHTYCDYKEICRYPHKPVD